MNHVALPEAEQGWPGLEELPRPWVVVLLMASECPEDACTRCVMSVVGPFPNREAAEAEAGNWPAWTTPHLMPVTAPTGIG